MSDFSNKIFPNLLPLSMPKGKSDLRKIGNEIHHIIVEGTRRAGYKQRVRKQIVELKSDRRYRPAEVAALLQVSYDTACRKMEKMTGCVDMGTKTKRYKRGKRMLTVSGKEIVAYLRSKTLG
jgi:hypothetical protein